MILRIIEGAPEEATEKDVAKKMATADERGFKINERLSTTHYDGRRGVLIFSLWFSKPRKSGDPLKSRLDFVEEPTAIELELMKCRNTQAVRVKERETIERFAIGLKNAQTLARFYLQNKKRTISEQNSRGMKREFVTIINNLDSQVGIANEWLLKVNQRPTAIGEPVWNWKAVRDELAARGPEGYAGLSWDELTHSRKQTIINLKP